MNGSGGFEACGGGAAGLVDGNNKISRNYKLLLDPLLVKGAQKVYRYDGVPDDPAYPPVFPCDPRKPVARVRRLEPMEMIVPRLVASGVNVYCPRF